MGSYRDKCICMDCDTNTMDIDEYYMLKFEVWFSIVPEDNGMLCIECVEKRLGRQLTSNDFLSCILNEEGWNQPRSDKLKDRMGFMELEEII
jgi:hypothetical protein